MGKQLTLGARLRYPITITKLLKNPGDTVKKQETVLEYSFQWLKEMGDHVSGDTWTERQTTIASWDSPVDGTLRSWCLHEGDAVHRDIPCMEVDEACSHEMQFHGMCAYCGEDMTEVNWASDQANTHRATVNMTHDQTGLMVSTQLATRAEHDTQRRLLTQRKLSLVVDLDQTIIHACIEPTVGDWMNDPNNPNYEAVKDVQKFQLDDEGPRGPVTSTCWYYIKMRPGLKEFLEDVSQIYELHVYTMGTRAYALNIAQVVDPQQKLFGNRVISRDESGSMIAKDLQRLFPVSTDMVVIIDDRADVWPRNRPNLIKVVPYDFFKGIGDINSSFMPKRRDILPAPEAPNDKETPAVSPDPKPVAAAAAPATSVAQPKEQTDAKPSAIAELAGMSDGDDKQLQEQAEEQERTLQQQLEDRPLLQAQEKLDKETEKAKDEAGEEAEDVERHQVLRDDDLELEFLKDHLTEVHHHFYRVYDEERGARPHTSPKQAPSHDKLRRKSREENPDDGVDLSMVPDVGEVLDDLKTKVLQDTVIVLSGLVPLGIDVMQSEIGLQAMTHGAQVHTRVTNLVTHLVVSTARTRTQKASQAARIPGVKIVNQNWLTDSISQWKHLDEEPYLVPVESRERSKSRQPNEISEVGVEQQPDLPAIRTEFTSSDEENSDEDEDETKTKSPVSPDLDWSAMDDELNEFLETSSDEEGDDKIGDKIDKENDSENENVDVNDDSDASDGSDAENVPPSGTKRKAENDAEGQENGSALAKRQRVAKDRGASKLSVMRNPGGEAAESSSLPTPQVTDGDGEADAHEGDGDGMDDLEADLEAAMELELSGLS